MSGKPYDCPVCKRLNRTGWVNVKANIYKCRCGAIEYEKVWYKPVEEL